MGCQIQVFLNRITRTCSGNGLKAVITALKQAAHGKGFRDYFLELISIQEFEEKKRGSALSVAEEYLGRQQLRTLTCPVTESVILVRGKKAEEHDTDNAVAALRFEAKQFKFIDTDGSGAVSVDELVHALEAQGISDAAGKAAEHIAKYDMTGDGMLQEEEYKALFMEVLQG
jgi:hypothetical protein